MSVAASAPCFPAEVSLVEIDNEQLCANAQVIQTVFHNMCSIVPSANVDQLVRNVVPPDVIRRSVLSFHWDEQGGCGYYVPYDVLPVLNFLGSLRGFVRIQNYATAVLRDLRVSVEQKYVAYLADFGGPFCFTVHYNPPAHMCRAGFVTPSRVASPNLHRVAGAQHPGDFIFSEFAHAVKERLYDQLQWFGVVYSIRHFLYQSCAPALGSAKSSPPDSPRVDTPLLGSNPFFLDRDAYRAMQFSSVMLLHDAAEQGPVTIDVVVAFPDLDEKSLSFENVQIDTLFDLEAYVRVAVGKHRFWAEVAVFDARGARMNHTTFETSVRGAGARFDVFMHRFQELPTFVRVVVFDADGVEQSRVESTSLTHRTFDALEGGARAMAAERLGNSDLLNPRAYAFSAVDTLENGERVRLDRRSYGAYVREHDVVMAVDFFPVA